jgi:hypothetical protein
MVITFSSALFLMLALNEAGVVFDAPNAAALFYGYYKMFKNPPTLLQQQIITHTADDCHQFLCSFQFSERRLFVFHTQKANANTYSLNLH